MAKLRNDTTFVDGSPLMKGIERTSSGGFIDLSPRFDTDGHFINSHGSGIMYYNGKYYMYGESKKGETLTPGARTAFIVSTGVTCYSSEDLRKWKYEGLVLPIDEDSEYFNTNMVIERPKVIHHEGVGDDDYFVLIWHCDDRSYGTATVGFAKFRDPLGPFEVVHAKRPLSDKSSNLQGTARDLNVLVDDDGSAYLYVSRDENMTMYIHKLTSDYLDFDDTAWTKILVNQQREAPAPFKYNGKYYVATSGCDYWNSTATKLHVADSPLGTYTEITGYLKNDKNNNSYDGQTTNVLKVARPDLIGGVEYIAMYDHWDYNSLANSYQIWYPVKFANGKPYIDGVNEKYIYVNDEATFNDYLIQDPLSPFCNTYLSTAVNALYYMANGIVDPNGNSRPDPIDYEKYAGYSVTTNGLAMNLIPDSFNDGDATWTPTVGASYGTLTWGTAAEPTKNGELIHVPSGAGGTSDIQLFKTAQSNYTLEWFFIPQVNTVAASTYYSFVVFNSETSPWPGPGCQILDDGAGTLRFFNVANDGAGIEYNVTYTQGTPYHVCLIGNSADRTEKLYINNTLVKTYNHTSSSALTSSGHLSIGRYETSDSRRAALDMGFVRFYNRVLSDEERKGNYYADLYKYRWM